MTTVEDYVAARGTALLRSAYLLTGDRLMAEDLVQTTLLKVWPRWGEITALGDPHAYVRRALLTTYLSWRRRPSFFERPSVISRDVPVGDADPDLRLVLVAALTRLPRRQRATVVLRYFEDLTEAQAAEVLGCSIGTVKSQTAKALRTLRHLLGDLDLEASLVR
jgi:RNA polymerase sigma-70 factor (sigma-E family)